MSLRGTMYHLTSSRRTPEVELLFGFIDGKCFQVEGWSKDFQPEEQAVWQKEWLFSFSFD